MKQILVRNLDDHIVESLKRRASRQGRSLQAEVRLILEQAAKTDMLAARRMLERYRKRFAGRKFSDSARLIREDRDR